jgi:hypothetical protein
MPARLLPGSARLRTCPHLGGQIREPNVGFSIEERDRVDYNQTDE